MVELKNDDSLYRDSVGRINTTTNESRTVTHHFDCENIHEEIIVGNLSAVTTERKINLGTNYNS